MTVIKAHKVNMNMTYKDYMVSHPDATKEEREKIIEKFVKELQEGPLLEIIKFFNLDDDDILELKKDNFAIGFKIRKDNTEEQSYDLSIRLDVKVEEDNPLGGPDLSSLMKGMANMVPPAPIEEAEGEVVCESEVSEDAEEAPADEEASEETAEEAPVKEATEEAPAEEVAEEEAPVEG
jgi:hypothetical protein